MARKKRIESIGFYHILNRGVARCNIYMDDEDRRAFLKIVQESAEVYHFEIYTFVLMDSHYQLLLKTSALNLSLLMRQINGRYTIYFNKKYNRVGPLWQGRFKSWYVYDENYLKLLVKYIEQYPVKTGMAKEVGQFKWSMSSRYSNLGCLNYALIEEVDIKKSITDSEYEALKSFSKAPLVQVDDSVVPKVKKSLEEHFEKANREIAIVHAIEDGYTQSEIAQYLNLSAVSVSKSYKNYRQKVKLFNKLREKGIFWSYGKDIDYDEAGEKLLIEHLYKYGDFDDIGSAFRLFGKRKMKQVWEDRLLNDQRFVKLNFMIARVFFGMDLEVSNLKAIKNERLEKLRMLAS